MEILFLILSVLGSILKFLFMTVFVILVIILVILLIVLISPIELVVDADIDSDNLEIDLNEVVAKVQIKYLFNALKIKIGYENGELYNKIKFLFFTIGGEKSEKTIKLQKFLGFIKKKLKVAWDFIATRFKRLVVKIGRAKTEANRAKRENKNTADVNTNTEEKQSSEFTKNKDIEVEIVTNKQDTIKERKSDYEDIPTEENKQSEVKKEKVKKDAKSDEVAKVSLKEKITYIVHLITYVKEYPNKDVIFKLTTSYLFKILKTFKPRYINVSGKFGLEDPADTGFAIGTIGIINTYKFANLDLEPDFSNECIDIQLGLSVKFKLITIVYYMLILLVKLLILHLKAMKQMKKS